MIGGFITYCIYLCIVIFFTDQIDSKQIISFFIYYIAYVFLYIHFIPPVFDINHIEIKLCDRYCRILMYIVHVTKTGGRYQPPNLIHRADTVVLILCDHHLLQSGKKKQEKQTHVLIE